MNFWIKSVDTDIKRYKIIYDFRKSSPVFSHPLSLFCVGLEGQWEWCRKREIGEKSMERNVNEAERLESPPDTS